MGNIPRYRKTAWTARPGVMLLVVSVWFGSVWMFFIQPMVGKVILPRFGGEPETWNTALSAFAIASVPGLLCAWFLSTLRDKRWAIVAVLTGFVLLLVLLSTWGLDRRSLVEGLLPFCGALCLLFTVQVILPFWFGQAAAPDWVDPYFVLAFAHLGALMSLVSYPFVVEPQVPTYYQYVLWLLGFAALGLLFLGCTLILGRAAIVCTVDRGTVPDDCPTWSRRFRWAVLGGIPTVLLTQGPQLPHPPAALHLIVIFELTLVVAYVRLPRGKPSRLSWAVQILAVLTCLPSLMAVAISLGGGAGEVLWLLALVGVLALALVPHRWCLALQGALCVTAFVLSAANINAPVSWMYLMHLVAVAVTGWGCYGDMVRDRPGPERLAEFLFFTGLAPSIVFVFVPVLIPLLSPRIVYPGIVLLALVARFLPGTNASTRNASIDQADRTTERVEAQCPIDTSITVLD